MSWQLLKHTARHGTVQIHSDPSAVRHKPGGGETCCKEVSESPFSQRKPTGSEVPKLASHPRAFSRRWCPTCAFCSFGGHRINTCAHVLGCRSNLNIGEKPSWLSAVCSCLYKTARIRQVALVSEMRAVLAADMQFKCDVQVPLDMAPERDPCDVDNVRQLRQTARKCRTGPSIPCVPRCTCSFRWSGASETHYPWP